MIPGYFAMEHVRPVNQIPKLSKFIQYVLGRHPDEFGLIADENGFVKIKILLQALHEESHWKFVRRSHFNELLLTFRPAAVEIQGNLIRCLDRTHLPRPATASTGLPKLLYTPIRQRSHPYVSTNGIYPNMGIPHVVLARDKEMALRMGQRLDNHPVLIIVKVNEAQAHGVIFKGYGEHLFLTEYLPPEVIISPPLPKIPTPASKTEKNSAPVQMKTPGSFFLDQDALDAPHSQKDKSKRRNAEKWKKQRRIARKHKKMMQKSDS